MIREVVKIDEEKCNGCGECVPACAEGAIQIIDGKAKLLADNLCDGLGACLGECPMDAISIEQREADEFDEEAVEAHLGKTAPEAHAPTGGCSSAAVKSFASSAGQVTAEAPSRPSQLRQWPVELQLVPPTAPFLQGADVLLVADCVPFAYADFHKDFLAGKALLVACPKLDDTGPYLDKLTTMLQQSHLRRLTVIHMEVPCCGGLVALARQAIAASGVEVPFETIKIGIQGDRLD
ncbi:4Fe-4S ferredoxin [Geothermobacter hydrogeniphilus]|uniref:4Fe-4S ferredoxin n=1 Tax=Geothermobacter hydrogeniphilus TaxID=1969733 RepID=A0A2K2H9N8_9BACT|nr:4Fe-4S binding protein [Geothermobacter hydrogeniphilus]PNU19950.1 4Fe-4S ferredoxin [Geothermobacter hydrogeniphilus]